MQSSHMIVSERFALKASYCDQLRRMTPQFGFGGFGEATYYRTYSRLKPDGSQEHWADTVIRVIDGVMSIRKNHYVSHRLAWNEPVWQAEAFGLAQSMFAMKWLPPGRGLWVMGTPYVFERGGAALNNCGAVDTTDLAAAADWTMDMLMCGVGVGFNTAWRGENVAIPDKSRPVPFLIPDSREGWVASVRLLIESYTKGGAWFAFDYDQIRPEGAPIRGFGGTASGYRPLLKLHQRIEEFMDRFALGEMETTRCVVDVFNAIGACVVAGNVRRSAEIALGGVEDQTFLDLKNYEINPDRAEIGWMSNNTVVLSETQEFEKLPQIAERIRNNGEPGIMNLINVQKYGRYGKESPDRAWLANPCAEIPLESFELCNLAEVFPARCADEADFYEAIRSATFYASTVSLLPTHRSETNAVVVRNRRIGVSLSGVADMLDGLGATQLTKRLRRAYKIVREVNAELAAEAGIPAAVRVTTVKPSGTISQLVGVSSGMHFPTFRYAIRRMRVGDNTPICEVLKRAGVPNEPDSYSENTTVFEFPIDQGKTRAATEVSAWEQFSLLAMLQREWSDNMVSCSIYFDPETEGHQIEHMLAQFAPIIKSVSMLPHSAAGAYKQMPYEGISKAMYEERLSAMPMIDWSRFGDSDGMESRYCSNDSCEV